MYKVEAGLSKSLDLRAIIFSENYLNMIRNSHVRYRVQNIREHHNFSEKELQNRALQ